MAARTFDLVCQECSSVTVHVLPKLVTCHRPEFTCQECGAMYSWRSIDVAAVAGVLFVFVSGLLLGAQFL